jgi:hypothetical protein
LNRWLFADGQEAQTIILQWRQEYNHHRLRRLRRSLGFHSLTADPDDWCGYIVAHFYDTTYAEQNFGSPPWFFISEIGTRTVT